MELSYREKRRLMGYFEIRKDRDRVKSEEEIKKNEELLRSIKGIVAITSKFNGSTIFTTPEDRANDELMCDYSCDGCGKIIRIYRRDLLKDKKDWIICDSSACELKMRGDSMPIIDDDNVMHYNGMLLTEDDLR